MTQDKPPAVINWDMVIHKNARSSDGQPVGEIVADLGDSLHIESAGSRGQWMVPKENVAAFNGAEVTLDFPESRLREFERAGP